MKNFIRMVSVGLCLLGTAVAAEPSPEEVSKGLQNAVGSLVDQSLVAAADTKSPDAQLPIVLPEKLKKLDATLQAAGQGQLMNDFKAKLKEVVAQSVPAAKDAFKGETSSMKIDDPMTVLKTGPDGLTNYTKSHTRPSLVNKVQPLIAAKSKESGLAASYQAMVAKAGPMASAIFGKEPPASLETSMAEQTVDCVYTQMGKKEAALRANPSLSKDALVQKIFSSVKK